MRSRLYEEQDYPAQMRLVNRQRAFKLASNNFCNRVVKSLLEGGNLFHKQSFEIRPSDPYTIGESSAEILRRSSGTVPDCNPLSSGDK